MARESTILLVTCAFCGGQPATREHVFPRWIERRFPPSGGRHTLEVARYGDGGFDKLRPNVVGLDFVVKKVCGACNNGWMARLEDSSTAVLIPLIAGLDAVRSVPLREQRQIALWATKTAMVMDLTQAVPLLPAAQRYRFRTHTAIPGHARVWIGACDSPEPLVTSVTTRIDLERTHEFGEPRIIGLYVAMKIGCLCLYVLFPQADVVIRRPWVYSAATARLWPRRGSDLPLPPPVRPRNGAEFEAFAGSFYGALEVSTPEHAARHGIREA